MGAAILLVEDDDDLREGLKDLLEGEGCTVSTAQNGREARQILEGGLTPRLIILDLLMPVMDGFAFRDWQRSEPRWARIPVAILSAVSGEYERENRLDAVAYVCKPTYPETLLELARHYC